MWPGLDSGQVNDYNIVDLIKLPWLAAEHLIILIEFLYFFYFEDDVETNCVYCFFSQVEKVLKLPFNSTIFKV